MERIRRDLPRILEGLTAIVVGTRDAQLVPSAALAAGIEADTEGRATVFVLDGEAGARTLANVEATGWLAVTMEQIGTHRTVQLKGRCLGIRPAEESERPIVDRCQEAFLSEVELIGAPPAARRRRRWPCKAVTIEVLEVFEQTPGPRAGFPFEIR